MNNSQYPASYSASSNQPQAQPALPNGGVQEIIAALQTLQQQTAYAHQRFLENQAQIQRTLQGLLAGCGMPWGGYAPLPWPGQFGTMPQWPAMMGAMPPMGQIAPMFPAPMPTMPPMAPMFNPGATWTAGQPSMNPAPAFASPLAQPMPNAQAPLAQPVPQPMPSAQVLAHPAPVPPTTPKQVVVPATPVAPPVAIASAQPATTAVKLDSVRSATPSASPSGDVSAAVIQIVADKTGFAPEMITPEMDMEADLGIDSIKRVEILAAVEEKLPGINTITPDEIGSLHTLAQVIERLNSGSNDQDKVQSDSVATPAGDIAATVISIVAEKTGFAPEMITLEMDMEADLGIDSIKRVEILAAVEEKLPGVNTITPDEIGNLHTLAQVIERLNSSSDSQDKTQQAPSNSSASADLMAIIKEIVAEKTGFAPEMITPEMDMEADLGIDSIKRVEILAAIEERVPDLPSISPDEVSNLHTLRQIAEHFRPF